MLVVTSREFRANQAKYFGLCAKGQDVIVTLRNRGSFKITPVTEDDTLMSKEAFFAKLDASIQQIKDGKCKSFDNAKDAVKYLESL